MRRLYVRLSQADALSPESGGFTRPLVGSVLTPTLCTAVIVWRARASHIEAAELAGAILIDLALWGICGMTLIEVYRAARYRARHQQHLDALAAQFADWVDEQRATWSSHR